MTGRFVHVQPVQGATPHERSFYLVCEGMLRAGELPTPTRLNEAVHGHRSRMLNGREAKVRARCFRDYGYAKDTRTGRWYLPEVRLAFSRETVLVMPDGHWPNAFHMGTYAVMGERAGAWRKYAMLPRGLAIERPDLPNEDEAHDAIRERFEQQRNITDYMEAP